MACVRVLHVCKSVSVCRQIAILSSDSRFLTAFLDLRGGGGGRDGWAGRACAVLSMRKWQGQVRFEINLYDVTVELLAASSAEACIQYV